MVHVHRACQLKMGRHKMWTCQWQWFLQFDASFVCDLCAKTYFYGSIFFSGSTKVMRTSANRWLIQPWRLEGHKCHDSSVPLFHASRGKRRQYMPWLQLRFDYDTITIRAPASNSTQAKNEHNMSVFRRSRIVVESQLWYRLNLSCRYVSTILFVSFAKWHFTEPY